MSSYYLETRDPAETFALGQKLGAAAVPGEVIALTGDLGAGKTAFAQGFARGLGVQEPVTSPTFTIQQLYGSGRLPLCHFDVYRIEEPEEMEEIGYEDAFYGDGVTLIEWADLIEELLPPDTVRIEIRRNPAMGDNFREITVTGEIPGLQESEGRG